LFADVQVLYICQTEDDLHRALYTLLNTIKQFQKKKSPLKSKVMAFKGQVPIRSKIVTDNTILEQVNTFTYLGRTISYNEEREITSKK
jgi:hypothetical protein